MPGKTIGTALSLGFPGSYSRSGDTVIVNKTAKGDLPFGAPVAINPDNTASLFTDANTEEQFIGFAAREVKQQTDYYDNNVLYKDKEPADILTRGSIIVRLGAGSPAANGPAYAHVAEDGGAFAGCIDAEPDAGNTPLSNVRFTTGRTDSSGVAEVTVLTRRA